MSELANLLGWCGRVLVTVQVQHHLCILLLLGPGPLGRRRLTILSCIQLILGSFA